MAPKKTVVVFVHGWSVTHTDTYGKLPRRLKAMAEQSNHPNLEVKEIHLGRYISFHDEVRVQDISRAFRTAVREQLDDVLADGTRFACVTHSTGGPVIRDWWYRYYASRESNSASRMSGDPCPMSHLIMLAPANYGSALAQLGKSRLGRLKSWLNRVEPGQGVLDWLELGSAESWELNTAWIQSEYSPTDAKGLFQFVLTGQSIDRKFYDNLNSYTGEIGSDGVVRVAAANLEGRYIRLVQQKPVLVKGKKGGLKAPLLDLAEFIEAPRTPLLVVAGKSHSDDTMGIMRSVGKFPRLGDSTVEAILECLNVNTVEDYKEVNRKFTGETNIVQNLEKVEEDPVLLLPDTYYIHDQFSMVVFRVRDDEGRPVADYDLLLTAGSNSDPNHLPKGFCTDRQRNRVNPETLTYFFNYDVMHGNDEVKNSKGEVIRPVLKGAKQLGFKINPRPLEGFVHYLPCEISASKELLEKAIRPNSTTLIDIRLRRVVHSNVFRLDKMTKTSRAKRFDNTKPGDEIAE